MPKEGDSIFCLTKQKTLIKPKVLHVPSAGKKLKSSGDLN